jgi:glucose-1-phosphate cytidylyltransferase
LVPLTDEKPKPLIEIGGIPILYHIINRLRLQGIEEFSIAGGYKWEMIRDYVAQNPVSGANVVVYNTGLESLTAERVKMIGPNSGPFIVTYGDDIPILTLERP